MKVYYKFRNRRWRRNYIVPEIRLSGKWLTEFGFEISKEISVEQEKNKLTITLIEDKENDIL
ncbi:SymE family type I addiction module toxin [Tenacibaculum aiptasiae]|uniref:SymE family type I addiction module toxin n=1 Tax=Tenacibaculum aiptasiae TaxID=426481 RepID=UPI001FE870DF|nr:SymE family type I addiction module toxin [Tenacibaculum aiptasiae]